MGSSASAPGGAGDLGATDIDPSKAPHPSKSRAPGSGLPKEIVLIIAQSNLLSLDDFVRLLATNKASHRLKSENLTLKILSRCHLGGRQRFRWWLQNVRMRTYLTTPTDTQLFHYLNIVCPMGAMRKSLTSPGQVGEVMRDVRRTYPTHPFFQQGMPGQDMLSRILLACLQASPVVGYCQGMNFVVGLLLLSHPMCSEVDFNSGSWRKHVQTSSVGHAVTGATHHHPASQATDAGAAKVSGNEVRDGGEGGAGGGESSSRLTGATALAAAGAVDEEGGEDSWGVSMTFNGFKLADAESDIFCILMSLIDRKGKFAMEAVWKPGMPAMRLYCFQFDRLLKWNFPKLHQHFRSIGFTLEILLSQWFFTLFAYTFPAGFVADSWDILMLGGRPAMFSMALAACGVLEDTLLRMDLEELSLDLRRWKNDKFTLPSGIHYEDIFEKALGLAVSAHELLGLEDAFASKLISEVLAAIKEDEAAAVRDAAVGVSTPKRILRKVTRFSIFPSSEKGDQSWEDSLGMAAPVSAEELLHQSHPDLGGVDGFSDDLKSLINEVHRQLIEINTQVESDKEVLQQKIKQAGAEVEKWRKDLAIAAAAEAEARTKVEGIANRISALETGRDDDAVDTSGTSSRSNSISGAMPDWAFRLSATAADIDTSGSGLDLASAGLDGSASGRERSSSFSSSGSGGRFSFFRSKPRSSTVEDYRSLSIAGSNGGEGLEQEEERLPAAELATPPSRGSVSAQESTKITINARAPFGSIFSDESPRNSSARDHNGSSLETDAAEQADGDARALEGGVQNAAAVKTRHGRGRRLFGASHKHLHHVSPKKGDTSSGGASGGGPAFGNLLVAARSGAGSGILDDPQPTATSVPPPSPASAPAPTSAGAETPRSKRGIISSFLLSTQINSLQKSLRAAVENLEKKTEIKGEINLFVEEADEKKNKLCAQLQLLVETTNKKRSSLLQLVVRKYLDCT